MSKKKIQPIGKLMKKQKDAYLLLAPFLLLFLMFILIPLVMTAVLAFFEYDLAGAPKFAGFDNFKALFGFDGRFTAALGNSLLIFLAGGLGGFVLSFAAAWGLEFLNGRLANILTAALFVISSVQTVVAAVWLSGALRAPLNSLMLTAGLTDVPADWLSDGRYALSCVIISQLLSSFGLGFLALRSGFGKIDRERADAARIEGVRNPLWTLLYAQIPSLYPQMAFAAVIQTAYSFTNSELLRILSGISASDFGAYGILSCVFEYGSKYDAGRVFAANFILIALMSVIYAAVRIVLKKLSAIGSRM